MSEILSFLRRSQLLEADYIDVMQNSLLAGGNLSLMMSQLGFSDTIVTQMALADIHGNSQRSLVKIDAYLTSMGAVRKKLLEVMTYPVMLLGFLVLIMVGLNHYLLPQLEGSNLATQLIQHFPLLFLVGTVMITLVVLALYLYQKRLPRIREIGRAHV